MTYEKINDYLEIQLNETRCRVDIINKRAFSGCSAIRCCSANHLSSCDILSAAILAAIIDAFFPKAGK